MSFTEEMRRQGLESTTRVVELRHPAGGGARPLRALAIDAGRPPWRWSGCGSRAGCRCCWSRCSSMRADSRVWRPGLRAGVAVRDTAGQGSGCASCVPGNGSSPCSSLAARRGCWSRRPADRVCSSRASRTTRRAGHGIRPLVGARRRHPDLSGARRGSHRDRGGRGRPPRASVTASAGTPVPSWGSTAATPRRTSCWPMRTAGSWRRCAGRPSPISRCPWRRRWRASTRSWTGALADAGLEPGQRPVAQVAAMCLAGADHAVRCAAADARYRRRRAWRRSSSSAMTRSPRCGPAATGPGVSRSSAARASTRWVWRRGRAARARRAIRGAWPDQR